MNQPTASCPKCQLPLSLRQIQGIQTGHCSSCKGLWLGKEQLAALLDPVAAEAAMRVRQLGDSFAQSTELACPACRTPLDQTWLAEIEVEHCSRCQGIFLDAGELEQVTYRDHSLENWGRTERKKRDEFLETWGMRLERLSDLDLSISGILSRLALRLTMPAKKSGKPPR